MNDVELQNLDKIVQRYYSEGDTSFVTEILKAWHHDIRYFSISKKVIQTSSFSPQFTHFALLSLESLIGHVCVLWKNEDFFDFSNWCLSLLSEQIDRFIEHTIVISAFCTMYARFVKLAWYCSSQFQSFSKSFVNFFGENPKHYYVEIIIYESIIQEMANFHYVETLQLDVFKETTILDWLKFSVNVLHNINDNKYPFDACSQKEIDDVLNACFQLMITCFSIDFFVPNNNSVEIEKITLNLPNSWKTLNFLEIITLGFIFYKSNSSIEVQKNALKLIFCISAISSKSKMQIFTNQTIYYSLVLSYICNIIEFNINISNDDNISLLLNIIIKIIFSLNYEIASQIESFPNFVKTILSLSSILFNVHFLSNNMEIIINLLKILEQIIYIIHKSNYINNQFNDFNHDIESIIISYFNLLSHLLEEEHLLSVDILFPDFSKISPLIQMISKIGKINGIKFYESIFSQFKDSLFNFQKNPDNKINEIKLCLNAMIIASPICSKSQNNERSLLLYSIFLLLNLINTTGDLINQGVNYAIYLEKTIVFIIYHLEKSSILQNTQLNILTKDLTTNQNYQTIQGIYHIIFCRLFISLETYPNETELVNSIIKAFSYGVDFGIKSCQELISDFILNLNKFNERQNGLINKIGNRRSRINLFKIISMIMFSGKSLDNFIGITRELDILIKEQEDKKDDETSLLNIIVYIHGLFKGISISNSYQALFEWFYPKYEILFQNVQELPNSQIEFIKFLVELVDNRNSRIMFELHSADGLKLFKAVSNSLTTFISNSSRSLENVRVITYSMQIMEKLFMNDFLNIGALEEYNDPALTNLLSSFLNYLKEISLCEILHYKKTSLALIRLMICILKRFLSNVIEIDSSFIEIALSISLEINEIYDDNDIKDVLNLISCIAKFCIKSKTLEIGNILENTNEKFNEILLMLEKMLYNSTFIIDIKIIKLMNLIIKFNLIAWKDVRQRLLIFFQNCKQKDFQNEIRELLTDT